TLRPLVHQLGLGFESRAHPLESVFVDQPGDVPRRRLGASRLQRAGPAVGLLGGVDDGTTVRGRIWRQRVAGRADQPVVVGVVGEGRAVEECLCGSTVRVTGKT
ncbi:hypothetical protein RZS08_04650, partial [Arthrospira platensis SPKY1]|nr:hypothetical protein [Arthrospira platensis SPKY1]